MEAYSHSEEVSIYQSTPFEKSRLQTAFPRKHPGKTMTIQTSYTQARAQLAALLDEVTHNREVVIIQRQGEDDVALIAADELTGLLETAHLLRSPANAERLLTTLARIRQRAGVAESIEELRREVGFDET
jgi:antitoxin YefM